MFNLVLKKTETHAHAGVSPESNASECLNQYLYPPIIFIWEQTARYTFEHSKKEILSTGLADCQIHPDKIWFSTWADLIVLPSYEHQHTHQFSNMSESSDKSNICFEADCITLQKEHPRHYMRKDDQTTDDMPLLFLCLWHGIYQSVVNFYFSAVWTNVFKLSAQVLSLTSLPCRTSSHLCADGWFIMSTVMYYTVLC